MSFSSEVVREGAGAIDIKFECKAADDETGAFEGYASVFGVKDRQGDIIEPGAFFGFGSKNAMGVSTVKMFSGHSSRDVPGVWKELYQDDKGLYAKGQLLLGTQNGREEYERVKAGAVDAMSVGFKIPKGGFRYDDKSDTGYISKAELFEISLVPIPANPAAMITNVKDFDPKEFSKKDLEILLRNHAGMSRRDVGALLSEGWDGIEAKRIGDVSDSGTERSKTDCNERDAEAAVNELKSELRTHMRATFSKLDSLKLLKASLHDGSVNY